MEGVPLNLIEMRSRLSGFDTQEAQRGPGRRDCQVHNLCGVREEIFYRGNSSDSGETSMSTTLESLVTVMVLTSITGYSWTFVASDTATQEGEPVPTLPRLEMAKRALRTGYAFPTNHYFVTNDLWEKFQEAIGQRRGGFSTEQFVHPYVCRRKRYKQEVRVTARRRHRYAE